MCIRDSWGSGFKCVSVFLNGDAIQAPGVRGERVIDDSFLLCFNAHDKAVEFVAPDGDYAKQWSGAVDTADPQGVSTLEVTAGETITLAPRSVLVLRKVT